MFQTPQDFRSTPVVGGIYNQHFASTWVLAVGPDNLRYWILQLLYKYNMVPEEITSEFCEYVPCSTMVHAVMRYTMVA